MQDVGGNYHPIYERGYAVIQLSMSLKAIVDGI
jgi:hypothetical protein